MVAYAAATIVDLAVTAARMSAARGARYAGHADPSFYFQFARNLATGRGATVDFVWHFLVMPPSIHHYAPDYWQPLPSVFMAASMRVMRSTSLPAALMACVLAAALVPVAAALLAHGLARHALIPPIVMGLTALSAPLARWSVAAESVAFYALFVLLALALACGRWNPHLRWPLAGVAASAAYLCRNDGLLLVVLFIAVLAVKALLAWGGAGRPKERLIDLGLFATGALVTLAPWVAANLHGMGRPIPPTVQLPFLANYEDMFAIGHRNSIEALLAGGVGQALSIRYDRVVRQAGNLVTAIGIWLTLLLPILVGTRLLLRLRRDSPRDHGHFGWPFAIAAMAIVFAFDALITPVASSTGAWARSVGAFVPVSIIAAVDAAVAISRRRILRVAALTVVAAAAIYPLVSAHDISQGIVAGHNAFGRQIARLQPLLEASAVPGRPVVVMTRSPWELTEVTGFHAVQIPNNDLCVILRTARRYGVTTIVLTPKRTALRNGAALRAARFTFVGRLGRTSVYRIPVTGGTCQSKADAMPRGADRPPGTGGAAPP
jgi:hypothetical protein